MIVHVAYLMAIAATRALNLVCNLLPCRFKRDGNTLTYTAKITLADALCGTVVKIEKLDSGIIELPIEGVSPQSGKLIK